MKARSADGVLHNFPDDTPPEVVDRVMKEYAQSQSSKEAASRLDDATSGVRDVIGQTARGALGAIEGIPGDLYDAVTALPRHLYRDITKGRPKTSEEYQEWAGKPTAQAMIENTPFVRDPPETPAGEFARTFGAMAVPFGGKGSGAARLASAVGSTAGLEAGRKLAEGHPNLEPLAELGGAIAGGHTPRAIKSFANPNRSSARHAADVQELRAQGVEPTAGDVMDSATVRKSEGTVGNAPGAGGAGSREHNRVGFEYTAAITRQMGSNADPATVPISDILNETKDRLQRSFDRVATQLPILPDQTFGLDYHNILDDLDAEGLPEADVNRIHQQLRNVNKAFSYQMSGRPVMTGDSYQALTRKKAPLDRAMNDVNPNIAHYASRIRTMVDDAMERTATSPNATQGQRDALAELKNTRRQWYTMLLVSRAAAMAGEDPAAGIISPQRLRSVLASTQDEKVQYALQRSNLSRLARAGNAVMAPPANSQTAERHFLMRVPEKILEAASNPIVTGGVGAATGGGLYGAMIGAAAPGVAGRVLMSKPAQAWLKRRNVTPLPPSTVRSTVGTALDQIPQSPEDVLDNPSGIPLQ